MHCSQHQNSPLEGSRRGVITIAFRSKPTKIQQAYFLTTTALIQHNTFHRLIRNTHGGGGAGELLEQVGGGAVRAALHHFE